MSGTARHVERVRVEIDPQSMLTGFVRHRRRFADAIARLNEDDLARPSRCTEWTVAGVLRHCVDTDGWLRASWEQRPPPYADPSFDPATTPRERLLAQGDVSDADARDQFVASSCGVAAEVEEVGRDRMNARAHSPIGEVPWWCATLHHFLDSFCHERDVLLPLGQRPPEVADESVPVLAWLLALAGLTVAGPTDVTVRGIRLVAGAGPPVVTPVAPRADVADAIDALSGRAPIDEVLSDVEPDVVAKLSILPRLIAGADAARGAGAAVSDAERAYLLDRRLPGARDG